MEQCSNTVKRNQWASIISACQSRPKGISKREWLDHNGITNKQRKLYELMDVPAPT